MNLNIEEIKEIFMAESSELLQTMESILLDFEKENYNDEKLNELFRSVHTIKGSAGIFGYENIVKFTHIVENVLDNLRENKLEFTKELNSLLIDCRDQISDLVEYTANHIEFSSEFLEKEKKLVQSLKSYLVEEKKLENETKQENLVEKTILQNWHISLRFHENTYKDGLDPYSIINYLNKEGEILYLYTLSKTIPSLENINPEACYFGFEILYRTSKDFSFILQSFEFVEFDCKINILSPTRTYDELNEFIQSYSESKFSILRILIQMGSIKLEEIQLLNLRKRNSKIASESEEVIEKEEIKQEEITKKNLPNTEKISSKKNNKETKMIRIDSNKLDYLINLVGELVIAGANLSQKNQDKKDSELSESVYLLNHLISEIRESALKIRMVQIGETFSRFQRTVRDIGNELNKEIDLKITGAETELDKTVVEKIYDPLIHLIRNAIDHGIESPSVRESIGKSKIGKLELNASHEAGSILIEVKDDGKGLDKEKILAKAIDKNLVNPDKVLSDDEIFRLIFQPGFSTAEKITNISGRGVGLDVVERGIDALRGTVTVSSTKDRGTSFKVKLPLTLAIIDGFLFKVGVYHYIVPLSQVVECFEFNKNEFNNQDSKNIINLRGEVLPYLRLSDFFSIEENSEIRKNILVLQYGSKKVGLLIETLHGEIQTVIKPLGKIFEKLKGISGSTILGSGEVALILDISELFKKAEIS
jgi:two-component system chemotaxis sensor kinase CheA